MRMALPESGVMNNVKGKRTLLTGVANEFGLDVVGTLAHHGCRLIIAGDAAELLHISTRINSLDSPIQLLELDSSKSIDATVHKAWQAYGGLDSYLACASYTGPLKPFLDTDEDEVNHIVDIIFRRVCLVSKAVGACMRDTGTEGSIIFVTSIIGSERGLFPGLSVASASLAAVNHLTRAIAMELGKHKIRVNAVARGLHESDASLKSMSAEVRQKEGKRIVPLQRWLDAKKDASSILLYLVGNSSSFLTGTIIFVDGGQSLTRARLRSYI